MSPRLFPPVEAEFLETVPIGFIAVLVLMTQAGLEIPLRTEAVAEASVILGALGVQIDVLESRKIGIDKKVRRGEHRRGRRGRNTTDYGIGIRYRRIEPPRVGGRCRQPRHGRNDPVARQGQGIGAGAVVGRLIGVGAVAQQFVIAEVEAELALLAVFALQVARFQAKIGALDAPARGVPAVVACPSAQVEIADAVGPFSSRPLYSPALKEPLLM